MNYDSRIETTQPQEEFRETNPLDYVDASDTKSRRRNWIIGIAILFALIAIWFLQHKKSGTDQQAEANNQTPVVSVVAPGQTSVVGQINANGTIAARREMPVGVAGEGGQIAQVLVEQGDWVQAGQVLAIVDRSVQVQQQVSSAAQIQVAQANARLAQANLDRALKLVERGFISKADIDRLTATRDAQAAQVRVANAQLNELQARTRRLNIVAPAAGLVLERKVEPGQVVGAGSGVLFRLAKGGEMELKTMVGEVELAKLTKGTVAQVTPVGSSKTFSGEVWQLAPTIDPQTRQGMARIALAYATELKPGGFASAVINSGTVTAPILPDSALLSDSKGTYVMIIDQNNKAQRRDIKTGMVSDAGIAIAEGLNGSERVVVRAAGFLSPGETVSPKLVKQ